jgi:predicted secreted hydrolase
MKSRIHRREFLALALPFAVALPGYRYQFPRDHLAHPEFQTEWWYYTGNLRSGSRRFGFQLTFFRQSKSRESSQQAWSQVWSDDPIWLAHSALSDIGDGHFHHAQRINRTGPGLAGVDAARGLVWNGNWQASQKSLRSVDPAYTLELSLLEQKPPVIHGSNGVSQKAAGAGRASHYISLSRIAARGKLIYQNRELVVDGLVWMDHEFFTHQLEPQQVGWDWFSVQLQNNCELMLYRLRRQDGTVDSFSAGTFIDAQGRSRHLTAGEFQLIPSGIWTSPATGARYPLRWQIKVPVLNIDLNASSPLAGQEIVSRFEFSPNYWEGAVDYQGTIASQPISGVGYLEMTGYDKPVKAL